VAGGTPLVHPPAPLIHPNTLTYLNMLPHPNMRARRRYWAPSVILGTVSDHDGGDGHA